MSLLHTFFLGQEWELARGASNPSFSRICKGPLHTRIAKSARFLLSLRVTTLLGTTVPLLAARCGIAGVTAAHAVSLRNPSRPSMGWEGGGCSWRWCGCHYCCHPDCDVVQLFTHSTDDFEVLLPDSSYWLRNHLYTLRWCLSGKYN